MTFYVPGQTITIETLETALDRLAVIMSEATDEGLTYLPIWQRLEQERDTLLTQSDLMSAVRLRQAQLLLKSAERGLRSESRRRL